MKFAHKIQVKHYFDKTWIYIYSAVMLIVMFAYINARFRGVDVPIINKILHPECFNEGLFPINLETYNPYFLYHYIAANLAKWWGLTENFNEIILLGKILWLLEMSIIIIGLIKLCDVVFKGDRVISIIAVLVYITFIRVYEEPANLAVMLFIFSVYYFVKSKWLISSILGALLFYVHIGWAVWWFLPFIFALLIILIHKKNISLKKIGICLFTVAIIASPIIIIYVSRIIGSKVDEFTNRYYYYIVLTAASPVRTLIYMPAYFIFIFLTFAIFVVGNIKSGRAGFRSDYILYIVLGMLVLFIVQFIFADILRNSFVIKMQLCRALINPGRIFGIMFFSYLLANQVKRGNYLFLFFFMLISSGYGILRGFLGDRKDIVYIVFGFVLLFYELFEGKILLFINRMHDEAGRNFKQIEYLRSCIKKINQILQRPIVIALVLLIMFIVPKLGIRSKIKAYIYPSMATSDKKKDCESDALDDLYSFINENLKDKKTAFLFNFTNEMDGYLTKTYHVPFFYGINTPVLTLFFNNEGAQKFKNILENDLNCPSDKILESIRNQDYDIWDEMWENLDEDLIINWKRKYGLTHVIRENDLPLDLPIIYENMFYTVYEIS